MWLIEQAWGRLVLLAMLAGVAGGCADQYTFASNLRPWNGQDFSRVTQVYGAPHTTRKRPDRTTEYEYTLHEGRCVTTWVVDDQNKILAWNYSGNCPPGPF